MLFSLKIWKKPLVDIGRLNSITHTNTPITIRIRKCCMTTANVLVNSAKDFQSFTPRRMQKSMKINKYVDHPSIILHQFTKFMSI